MEAEIFFSAIRQSRAEAARASGKRRSAAPRHRAGVRFITERTVAPADQAHFSAALRDKMTAILQ